MHDAFLHRRSFCRLALALAATPLARAEAADDAGGTFGRWVHAVAAYGPPKYGPEFTHFEYVDPRAPKGGTLRLRNPTAAPASTSSTPSPRAATRRPAS